MLPSPKTVASHPCDGMVECPPPLSLSEETLDNKKLSLDDFIAKLPDTIRRAHAEPHSEDDGPILSLYKRLSIGKDDYERYAFFEPSKKYTRNLIATDDKTFTLILMCWNPCMFSPIHDHPCDGCWMRVCEGCVRETRYTRSESTNSLECVSDQCFVEDQLAYITDKIGLHSVGNPSSEDRAITIHLYSPPFKTCHVWTNPSNASKASKCCMSFHSKFGVK